VKVDLLGLFGHAPSLIPLRVPPPEPIPAPCLPRQYFRITPHDHALNLDLVRIDKDGLHRDVRPAADESCPRGSR